MLVENSDFQHFRISCKTLKHWNGYLSFGNCFCESAHLGNLLFWFHFQPYRQRREYIFEWAAKYVQLYYHAPFAWIWLRGYVLCFVLFFSFFLEVWRALLKEMPLQSVLRILGKMTSNKILEPGSSETQAVCDRIQSETSLKKVGTIALAD